MSVVESEYGDITEDGDDGTRFFVGRSLDEELQNGEREWLDFDEAVALCGFVEGAIPGAGVLIEGNGGWAQSMISRTDFSGLAISKKEKLSYKRTSNLFWKHFRRGRKAAKRKLTRASGGNKVEV